MYKPSEPDKPDKATKPVKPAKPDKPIKPYKSPLLLARVTAVGQAVIIIFALVNSQLCLSSSVALNDLNPDDVVKLDTLPINGFLNADVEYAHYLVYAFAGVTFIMWFKRLVDNLPSLQIKDFPISSNWAIFSFWIPIVWLYKPFTLMLETYAASLPGSTSYVKWKDIKKPRIINFWWFFADAHILVGRGIQLGDEKSDFARMANHAFQTSCYVATAGNLIEITSVLLAMLLIKKMTTLQIEKHELVSKAAPASRVITD